MALNSWSYRHTLREKELSIKPHVWTHHNKMNGKHRHILNVARACLFLLNHYDPTIDDW